MNEEWSKRRYRGIAVPEGHMLKTIPDDNGLRNRNEERYVWRFNNEKKCTLFLGGLGLRAADVISSRNTF